MLKQAVFLVGGRGTRLGCITDDTPKPLLKVGDRPFLDYLIEKAVRLGLTDIVLLAGYLGHRIERHYSKNPPPGATISVTIEAAPLGTGGALAAAADLLDDRFLMANGDTLFDFNWRDLDRIGDAAGVIALRSITTPGRYSAVTLDGRHITRFGDTHEDGKPCLINGGVYVLGRNLVPAAADTPQSLENDVFPGLARSGALAGVVSDAYFIDMGVPDDFARAQVEVPRRLHHRAIIFDRDGVLNVDHGYVHDWNAFEWIPGAREAIRMANDRGYFVCVVTNQAGVARGYYDETAIATLHAKMNEDLATVGAHINHFEYCPHHPAAVRPEYRQDCARRKPNPGMILSFLRAWQLVPGDCVMIGDKDIDMMAAQAAGVPCHLFKGGNLRDFVSPLLNHENYPLDRTFWPETPH